MIVSIDEKIQLWLYCSYHNSEKIINLEVILQLQI